MQDPWYVAIASSLTAFLVWAGRVVIEEWRDNRRRDDERAAALQKKARDDESRAPSGDD